MGCPTSGAARTAGADSPTGGTPVADRAADILPNRVAITINMVAAHRTNGANPIGRLRPERSDEV